MFMGAALCTVGLAAPSNKQQTPLGVPYQGKHKPQIGMMYSTPYKINPGKEIVVLKEILKTEKVPFIEHVAGKDNASSFSRPV